MYDIFSTTCFRLRTNIMPVKCLLVFVLINLNFTVDSLIAQEDADATVELDYRPLAARTNQTIFSSLELPPPSRLRNAAGLPGPDYWQQQADYKMDVTLDPENESVSAVATIRYTNNSPEPLEFLWLSLEQNLFKENSLGSLTTPRAARFNNRTQFMGGYEIKHVRMGENDLKLMVYDTLGRLNLPEPVAANGGQVEFEIAWSFNIPRYGIDRMGVRQVRAGKIFQIAQWFPQVCKYDDVHGWNHLPYLGQGEFYSDFGSYDVTITAPRGHVVIGTGQLVNPKDVLTKEQQLQFLFAQSSRSTVVIRGADQLNANKVEPEATKSEDGQSEDGDAKDDEAKVGEAQIAQDQPNDVLSWHFKADKVRDFAWTSSDATIWDAASITWDDGSTVLVQSVYPEEARGAWSESTQMLRHSILAYSEQWFRYPYPTATNVNGNVGGMEYPMIIFCGGDRNRNGLFAVTSHEIGHNWFPMVVNTDERRHAWMDEGFNTFINAYDRLEVYDHVVNGEDSPRELRPISLRSLGRFNANPRIQPIVTPADQINPNLLGQLAYNKPAVGLRYLREVVVGPERFDAAFQQYIRAWAFKSPQPSDFFRCMENGTGMNLDWFWRGWYLENLELDQGIASARPYRRRDAIRVELVNLKEMVMPVQLRVEFEDGTEKDISLPVQIWNYTNQWTAVVPTDGKTVRKITLDPDQVMPDSQRKNNTWEAPQAKVESENDSDSEDDAEKKSDDENDK
jgi:hypothetical protein